MISCLQKLQFGDEVIRKPGWNSLVFYQRAGDWIYLMSPKDFTKFLAIQKRRLPHSRYYWLDCAKSYSLVDIKNGHSILFPIKIIKGKYV